MRRGLVLLSSLLAAALLYSVSVSAAGESEIIDALKDAGVPDMYVSIAESYMAKPDVELTQGQIDAIVADIHDAKTIAGGETDYDNMTGEQHEKIVAKVSDAANILGLKTTYSSSKNLSIIDSTGSTLLSVNMGGAVKKTGYDYTTIFVGLSLIGIGALSGIFAKSILRREKRKKDPD